MNIKISNFEQAVYDESLKAKSAWRRGVAKYALDLISDLKERGKTEIDPQSPAFEKMCLNGAENWKQYSEGGCSLICDFEVVERLCTASEKRKYNAGRLERPNANETWLECQARALYQAVRMIKEKASTHARAYDITKCA